MASRVLFPKHIPEASNQSNYTAIPETPASGAFHASLSSSSGGPIQPSGMDDKEYTRILSILKGMFEKIVVNYIMVDSVSQVPLSAKRRKLVLKVYEEGSVNPNVLSVAYEDIASTVRFNFLNMFLKSQHDIATLDAILEGMISCSF